VDDEDEDAEINRILAEFGLELPDVETDEGGDDLDWGAWE
jgi:hypothetical protein